MLLQDQTVPGTRGQARHGRQPDLLVHLLALSLPGNFVSVALQFDRRISQRASQQKPHPGGEDPADVGKFHPVRRQGERDGVPQFIPGGGIGAHEKLSQADFESVGRGRMDP